MNDGQPGNVIQPGAKLPETSWQFNAQEEVPSNDQKHEQHDQPSDSISWSASEFIAHNKSGGWYGMLLVGAVLLAALVFVLTKDKVSAAVVVVVAIVFGIFAGRKPRELNYAVDNKGIHISEKFYAYNSFRSFSIVQEDAVESIWLTPAKRFMPMLSIYFDPADGEKIVGVLSQYLPVQNHQLDTVDKLMNRMRF